MRTNRTRDEWDEWCFVRNRIADELKEYYRACTTRELAPELKLDEELHKKRSHSAVTWTPHPAALVRRGIGRLLWRERRWRQMFFKLSKNPRINVKYNFDHD